MASIRKVKKRLKREMERAKELKRVYHQEYRQNRTTENRERFLDMYRTLGLLEYRLEKLKRKKQ